MLALANEVATQASAQRIERWKTTVADDLHRLAEWIKATPLPLDPPCQSDQIAESPHPQIQAEAEAKSWAKIWCPDSPPAPDSVLPLLHVLPRLPAPCPLPTIEGKVLQQLAKESERKAAGVDGWHGAQWKVLPIEFFIALANIWNACLAGAPVPAVWKHVRIALLPKPDGGKRPLAIAALAWRVCMKATMRQLRPWICQWTPPELCGGVPNKGIHSVHALLFSDLEACKEARSHLVGCKADVRKCFDSVSPTIAFSIWRHLGAPSGVLHVLQEFYTNQQRWMAVRGHYAAQPIVSTCSVLQGCPASPALLNAMMTVWVHALRAHRPQVHLAIYLDDRTVWSKGAEAIRQVVDTMQYAQQIDAALGFKLHPDKLEAFATISSDHSRLANFQDCIGPVKTTFKLLGITYFVASRAQCSQDTVIRDTVVHRARKIRVVTKNLQLRKWLVNLLVISIFRWMGPWQRFPIKTLRSWGISIESAIWGRRPASGRSRYLFWTLIGGVDNHPQGALVVEALKAEWKRQTSLQCGFAAPARMTKLSKIALELVQWTVLRDNVWQTPYGQIRVGFVSDAVFKQVALKSFSRVLWNTDTKVNSLLEAHQEPYLGFQSAATKEGIVDAYKLRVFMGAATDGRTLQRLGSAKQCPCGNECPDRTHLTFDCIAVPPEHQVVRRSDTECRMLIPLVSLPPVPPCDSLLPCQSLVSKLRQSFYLTARPVILALDGSCLISSFRNFASWQKASWGIVTQQLDKFQGFVMGLEQTPAHAERSALLHALLASSTARVPVRLLIDNLAVVKRLRRGLGLKTWLGDSLAFWHFIAGLCETGVEVEWIPSHDKLVSWEPSNNWGVDAATCRKLNAAADRAAAELTEQAFQNFARREEETARAHRWAEHAVVSQIHATVHFHEEFVMLLKQR